VEFTIHVVYAPDGEIWKKSARYFGVLATAKGGARLKACIP